MTIMTQPAQLDPLGLNEAELDRLGGRWTAREIDQQPETLRATDDLVRSRSAEIAAFVDPILSDPRARVIFAGAGTSSFIGQCLAPWMASRFAAAIESIATTDIVSAPAYYLDPARPTLLVSFGRSGNSPESIGAVDCANKLIANVRHLAITCNADGALAKMVAEVPAGLSLVLPDATHDQSFAMTSSFTAMLYAALAAFLPRDASPARLNAIAASTRDAIDRGNPAMRELARGGFNRMVFLGSHVLKGLAMEGALKMLELTNGGIVTAHDSTLGFRHGPKTIINKETLVVVMLSNDPLTRRYDLDLIEEIGGDGDAGAVLAVAANPQAIPDLATRFQIDGMGDAADVDLLFPYISLAQMLAFHASLALGRSPDNPNPSGAVNRVVQGVTLYGTGA